MGASPAAPVPGDHRCLAITAIYVLLGGAAFFTGVFDVPIAGIAVAVRHAQKLCRIAAVFLLAWGAARWLGLAAGTKR